MLFSRLLLLPLAVASSVTLYVAPVPASGDTAAIASPVPLAQIDYDADQPVGTLVSYTPPTGSYSTDRLLRVGLTDPKSSSLHGVVTSAASFSEQYHKKIVIYVDDKGEPFHVGFSTSAKGSGKEVEVEIQKKNTGPKPVLNKPIVLNAEGKLGGEEPEKTFLQKWVELQFLLGESILTTMQVLVGYRSLSDCSASRRWWREIRTGQAGRLNRCPVKNKGCIQCLLTLLSHVISAPSYSAFHRVHDPHMTALAAVRQNSLHIQGKSHELSYILYHQVDVKSSIMLGISMHASCGSSGKSRGS